jgi:chemotaxis protein MotB
MLGSRRRIATVVNVWPGYVDALSALLMLVIFMLLIFTVAQIFLAETVSSRDAELDLLNDKLAEISVALQVQRNTNQALSEKLSILRNQYTQGVFFQNALKEQLAELEKTVTADKQTISIQLSELAQLEHDIIALRQVRMDLEADVASLASTLQNQDQKVEQLETELDNRLAQIGTLRDNSKFLQTKLASQESMTMLVQKDIEKKEFLIQDLVAIVGEGKEALRNEKQLSASAYADVKNLSKQIDRKSTRLNSSHRT